MCKNMQTVKGRSRGVLTEAVLRLLDERDPSAVTVTDIVSEAGVTRPTFYATFGDLSHAFSDAALSRLASLFDEADESEGLATNIAKILLLFEKHAEFFYRILNGPGGQYVTERLIKYISYRIEEHAPLADPLKSGPLPVSFTATGLAAGVVWLLRDWVGRSEREPLNELTNRMTTFIVRAVGGGLGAKDA